jgi:hypothetical protein
VPLGIFILVVCVLLAVLLGGRWFVNANPATIANALRLIGAGVLGALALFFILTGRFAWGMPLAVIAVGLVRRWVLPRFGNPFGGGGGGRGSPGQTSDVETDYLTMTLEHDTGVMHGQVRRGPYTGKSLSELDLNQLVSLLADCHREDPEAAQLLETYLDRTQGADWRDAAQTGRGEAGGAAGDGPRGGSGGRGRGGMSRDEALEVLGLDAGASDEEIREAHRRLMLKMHPDRGGSDYMAAKINEAKDVLLGR